MNPLFGRRLFEQLEDRSMLSSVQLDIRADPLTRTWEVFASVSTNDNAGLAGVAFNVVGSNGLTVATATFQPPPNFETESQNQPTVGQNMSGLQDRNTAAPGVGQATPVKLASGTYTGFAGQLSVEALGNGASVLPSGWQPNTNTNPVVADTFFSDSQSIAAVFGDANRNSVVDAADLISVQCNMDDAGTPGIDGDADLNGTVNTTDFEAVVQSLGARSENTPTALNDNFATNEEVNITRTAPGVLGNDTGPTGSTLTAKLVTNVTSGTLTLNNDGSFVYVPNVNFTGTDTFTYRAVNGVNQSNLATVTITVNPVNDVADANDDSFTINEDVTLNQAAPGLLANDTDAESNPLTAVLETQPTHGTLTLNNDGSFTYVPDEDFTGTDTFTYRANDGTANSEPATVTIRVDPIDDLPIAQNDTFSTATNVPLDVTAPGVLGNDVDVENTALSATLVTSVTNGTLTLNPNGSFNYSPAAGFTGTDTFTYRAMAGTQTSNVATVSIHVGVSVPTANDDSFNATEDTPFTAPAPGVLGNDTDPNQLPLTAMIVTEPDNGSVVLNADGSFTYTPNQDFNGTDTFTYQAKNSGLSSPPATVTITVAPVNDAPVAVGNLFAFDEDTVLTIGAPGLLVDDTDAENDPLTAILETQATNGTVVLNGNGAFTYTPVDNFHGTDSFTYRVTDGEFESAPVTVTLTVNSIPEPPVASDDSFTTTEGTPLIEAAPGVLLNDTDDDNSPLTAALVTGPTNGTLTLNPDGSFTYTPAPGFSGADSFTYQANDGAADSNVAIVNIIVNGINDSPVATDDSFSMDEDGTLTIAAPGVLTNDTDADNDMLTAALVTDAANGTLTLNADGSFTYVPDAGFNGTDSFQYQAGDNIATSNIATVTITIDAVDDAPAAQDDTFTVAQDTLLTVPAPGVLTNDTDQDGDSLTAAVETNPAHGTLALAADGSFTYMPDPGYVGPDSFTYVANDGTADSNIATVNITVTPANQAPSANDDSFDVDEDGTLTVPAPGVLGNDTDPESQPITAAVVTNPTNGSLTLNSDGSFTYMPNPDFNGTDNFVYRANDGTDDSNDATVVITVNATNDAPVATDETFTTDEDSDLIEGAPGLLTNATDVDGDFLTASLVSNAANGNVTLNDDGSFVYSPLPDFSGTDTFTYVVNDGTADSNVATVTITVAPVNDAPLAGDNSFETDEDVTLVVDAPGLIQTTSDVDGDSLTVAVVDNPTNGMLTLNPDGSFTYEPNDGFNGTDTFTYQASDGNELSNVATVTITVNAVNDPPVNTVPTDPLTTPADTPVQFTGGNAITIADDDSAAGVFTVTLTATNGSLTLASLSGLSFTEGDGTDDVTMTFTGSLTDVNAALDGLTFTPSPGFTGPASVQIVTQDDELASDDDTINITVG